MYNTPWIDRPANYEPSAEELALKETFQAAQKIAFSLVCASNQYSNLESPDVTVCAALLRDAVHKPEKVRANAIKAAQQVVLQRQVKYISTLAYYLQYADAWKQIRPTLVAQLEAVAVPKDEPRQPSWATTPYVDIDLCLNCESVAALIEGCDVAINDANRRHQYSRPTQKHAEAAFQKAFDALVAEVGDQFWLANTRLAFCPSRYGADILRDLPVDNVSSSHVPAQYEKCNALDAAREAFEKAFCNDTTTRCRDFNENTRGTVNDTQLAEELLTATPDVDRMQHIEERRDAKLRTFGRSWRSVRHLVNHCQALFGKVAEALPEALAEAAAIEDEKVRRQAQNLCLFAARRLKENLKYIRDCDRFVADYITTDASAAIGRGHKQLVERIKSKELQRPSNRCTEEPYCG